MTETTIYLSISSRDKLCLFIAQTIFFFSKTFNLITTPNKREKKHTHTQTETKVHVFSHLRYQSDIERL